MLISLIVAVSENDVIGRDNTLPWHLPADIKFFKEKTMGHCVVTGRKNYESIPEKFRPLSGRTNIIITRNKNAQFPGSVIVHSLEEALNEARSRNESECFIIGGGEIFRQSLAYADRIYLTRIHHEFEGDVFFPSLEANQWKEVSRIKFPADEKNRFDFSFLTLEKTRD